ncbi:MFS transporter [Streptomyces griseiscabiei]|uniref:MFS transporter n=1 Tax=Streptomyces griseiscabiei TaxID=2993540 RepID=A0ABU4LH13_9ACTN|nr:MFS transporter [Streptomyces griseiscabiei]MBZ3907926.1 MFS transporter [Streptomyces griseiscabiei]MDX2915074.1 MFS transporter [Streptomyces griseiscabiei]
MKRPTAPRTAAFAAPAGAGPHRGPALWGLLFVLAANMLIDALEVSVALVALPAIGDDLGLAPHQLQWVVSGFAAGFGALLLFGGRLVAVLGRRPVYLGALLVFAAASLVGALADQAPLLVATRFLKGFCVALTAPTGLAIIMSAFPEGPARGRALSVYSLFGASGFSAGLVLSGALTEVSWRWTFAFPAPVALLLFAFARRLIPRDAPPPGTPRRYDAAGALSLTAATLLAVAGIAAGPAVGWAHPLTLGTLLLAALSALVLVRVERTTRQPLLPAELFRQRALVRSALGAGALNGSYLGLLLVSTLHLQQQAGYGPWQTGLAFLPAAAPLALTALHSGRLVTRFGPARLIAAGAAAAPLGYLLYPREGAAVRYVTDVLPTMLLVGAAFVLAFTAFHTQATGSVPEPLRAAAGSFYQTAVQLAAALTTVLCAALYPLGRGPALVPVTAVALAGLAVALHGLVPRRTRPGGRPRASGPPGTALPYGNRHSHGPGDTP